MISLKEKKERRIGTRLHLKGERCNSPKCAVVRKPYPPGVHGEKRRRALSDFGRQLKEKQKVKYVYGVKEKTLSRILEEAGRKPTLTLSRLGEILERRLDNVVYFLGFASSRRAARQLISHGHILVNNKKVKSAGFEVKKEDIISIRAESKNKKFFQDLSSRLQKYKSPEWLELEPQKMEGRVKSFPLKSEQPFELNLLVELFSK